MFDSHGFITGLAVILTLAGIISRPLLAAIAAPRPITTLDYAGVALWPLGVGFEGGNGNRRLWLLVIGVIFAGCSAVQRPAIQTVPHVDLPRFMGDWYVIANIPTFVETDAYNAVESYRLDADGTIATTFTFRQGGYDGALKSHHPRGFVLDTHSNAVWGMQFIWPFKGDFRVVYLNSDYTQTVIGREKRDYVWIMARQPTMPDADYRRIVELLAREGYDTTRIHKVPQRWEPAQSAN